MTAEHIRDYAFISDSQSAAIISRFGSIDWYCPERFDYPSLFGRILDDDGGHWVLQPEQWNTVERAYIQDTLVLKTTFHTDTGTAEQIDALILAEGERGHDVGLHAPNVLVRQVHCTSGSVKYRMQLSPRPHYGEQSASLSPSQRGVTINTSKDVIELIGNRPVTINNGCIEASFTVNKGESVRFALDTRGRNEPAKQVDSSHALNETIEGWKSWTKTHTVYSGAYADEVRQSALIIRGLTHRPTGAIVAAPTTSLPEVFGSDWNWDYRYVWLRDFSLTLQALKQVTCLDEVNKVFQWVVHAIGDIEQAGHELRIMYDVDGNYKLPERFREGWSGFQKSTPVRIGNRAWRQQQLDVPGEVLNSFFMYQEALKFGNRMVHALRALAHSVVEDWKSPDYGMWELRDRERHYTSSKVLCWVALDRAIKMGDVLGSEQDRDRWKQARDEVRQAILANAWSDKAGAYAGSFGSDNLDASVLVMPLVGFVEAKEPRMRATILAIADKLCSDGFVHRWEGEVNAFYLCHFWLVECLALLDENDRARELFERALSSANDLRLLSEMIKPATGELVGNFPQTFSHIGLINAAHRLQNRRGEAEG